jgi:CheY-like chemotaxis protein
MKLLKDYEPHFGIFHDLMKFRVREILLVSSYYDAFVLEEDGRISEKIFSEYLDLNLRYVPRINRVSSAEEALLLLKEGHYDLVITMMRIADMDVMEFGRKVKEINPELPVVLLTYEWVGIDLFSQLRTSANIDKIFFWSGDTRILLAIIKYVEDIKNIDQDIKQGVQVILILEDSPKFYSMYLPGIYTEIMTQTRLLITEGINDLHRLLRMRARPKIIMAETYEQGMKLFRKYRKKLLGIISDVEFIRKGEMDDAAGFLFAEKVRGEIHDMPILIQSAKLKNREIAVQHELDFINKNSPHLLQELRQFILSRFGFGDFVFSYPDGREVGRAGSLHEFQKMIQIIPAESLEFHASRNHISIWLRARTEFETAEKSPV